LKTVAFLPESTTKASPWNNFKDYEKLFQKQRHSLLRRTHWCIKHLKEHNGRRWSHVWKVWMCGCLFIRKRFLLLLSLIGIFRYTKTHRFNYYFDVDAVIVVIVTDVVVVARGSEGEGGSMMFLFTENHHLRKNAYHCNENLGDSNFETHKWFYFHPIIKT